MRRIDILIPLLFILGLILSGCSPTEPTPSPPEGPAAALTAVPTAAPTATPVPTDEPPSLIFLSPPGSTSLSAPGAQADELEALLAAFAGEAGLRFRKEPSLSAGDLPPGVRLVVALGPDTGVAEMARLAPETKFLGIGVPGLQPGKNLSVIGAESVRPDLKGFLAGYIAAVITQDWRVGVISASDTGAGRAARQGFLNGVIYYCGLCRPTYPPYIQYPVAVELNTAATDAEQQAAADSLISQAVKTVYVFPGVGGEGLFQYLADSGIQVIRGDASPATRSNTVVSIETDLLAAVEEALAGLMNQEEGIFIQTPFTLKNANPDLLSPGRQRLAEETLQGLLDGVIDTGIDPVTGEPH